MIFYGLCAWLLLYGWYAGVILFGQCAWAILYGWYAWVTLNCWYDEIIL